MAIYIDANVLIPWANLGHLERVAVSIAARKLEMEIVIPAMATDEAEAHQVRRLETARRDLRSAQAAFNELFSAPVISETPPDIAGIISDWRESLTTLFVVKTHPQGAAEEALRREVLRLPPARATYDAKGRDTGATGSRDALIWLTILDDMGARNESGHFISGNKDFIRKGTLREELAGEIPNNLTLTGHHSAFSFLQVLGEHQPKVEVTVEQLDSLASKLVKELLEQEEVWTIPMAVFDGASTDWIYQTTLSRAEPMRVRGARRWKSDDADLTVIDSEWHVTTTVARYPTFSDGAPEVEEDIELVGTIQLYLSDEGQEGDPTPELVSGRFVRTDPGDH